MNTPSNWKQCVWKSDDGRDNGLIKVKEILSRVNSKSNSPMFILHSEENAGLASVCET